MPVSRLSFPKYKLGKSQNGILILLPRYISPITSSDVTHIYPKLTIVVVYCQRLLER